MSSKTLLEGVEARMRKLGLKDADVSRLSGRADIVKNIRSAATANKPYSPRFDTLSELARALKTTPQWLTRREPPEEFEDDGVPFNMLTDSHDSNWGNSNFPYSEHEIPVFAAVEGGSGDLEISPDPVDIVHRPWYLGRIRDGFAVIITGESMIPAFDPGDIAVVNPRLPFINGKPHIFTAESRNSHYKASIKNLVGVTDKAWKVEQFNPRKTFDLPRDIWTNARRIVGKFNG